MNNNWKRAGALLMGMFTANPSITEDEQKALAAAIDEDTKDLVAPPAAGFDAAVAIGEIVGLASAEIGKKLEAANGQVTALTAELGTEKANALEVKGKFDAAEAERARLQGLWDAHEASLAGGSAGEVLPAAGEGNLTEKQILKAKADALKAKWGEI